MPPEWIFAIAAITATAAIFIGGANHIMGRLAGHDVTLAQHLERIAAMAARHDEAMTQIMDVLDEIRQNLRDMNARVNRTVEQKK